MNKGILICAGPGTRMFTREQEQEMIEAFSKAFEEYQIILMEEAMQLETLSSSVTYATVQPDKESVIELKRRLKYAKSPMETIQIQREIGAISKNIRKKG